MEKSNKIGANVLPFVDQVRIPAKGNKVYKDECTYSFETPVSSSF
jgi:hypothetical protein